MFQPLLPAIIYIFFNLTAPGLICGTSDLQSLLQDVGSLVVACELLVAACVTQFPNQGSNLGPLHWECGILATVSPGKSPLLP